jgi:predicted TIM-barrel enzyme
MHSANEIRKAIDHLQFNVWVRCWADGVIWCGAEYGSEMRSREIEAALARAGYQTRRSGRPGTSGEYIVEIVQ